MKCGLSEGRWVSLWVSGNMRFFLGIYMDIPTFLYVGFVRVVVHGPWMVDLYMLKTPMNF